jgi:hypothetical protein
MSCPCKHGRDLAPFVNTLKIFVFFQNLFNTLKIFSFFKSYFSILKKLDI